MRACAIGCPSGASPGALQNTRNTAETPYMLHCTKKNTSETLLNRPTKTTQNTSEHSAPGPGRQQSPTWSSRSRQRSGARSDANARPASQGQQGSRDSRSAPRRAREWRAETYQVGLATCRTPVSPLPSLLSTMEENLKFNQQLLLSYYASYARVH